MHDVLAEKDLYLSNFERFEQATAADTPPWLRQLHRDAIATFARRGFPTARNEDWKFTNVAPLVRVPFQPAAGDSSCVGAADLRPYTFADCVQMVFVNGRFAPQLSSLSGLPAGARVLSLREAMREHPKQVELHLARYARFEDHPFLALNTAFLDDGAFLAVGKGVVLERPVHLLFVSTAADEPTVSYPRTLVLAGSNSQMTLIESYVGPDDAVYFTNGVTEVAADEGAVLHHYKVVREGNEAFHVAALQVHQARSSTFSSTFVTLGGRLVRNEARAVLDGEGGECTLNGLYLADGERHVDNHTVIDHAKAHCASHELYKGILDDKAHGVFNGKIFVRQDAQKTDAKQTNQTLLLSDNATINTKPQLEIFADDVKCTHGATVGQLDAEALFYLRSRGISLETARSLLIYAFANDILDRIRVEPVRARLERLLTATHLTQGPSLQEAL